MKWTAVDFKKSVGDIPTTEDAEFVNDTLEMHNPDIVVGPNWISFILACKGRVFIPNTKMDVFWTICKNADYEVEVSNMK